eukprot:2360766-Amphidinium_carterae.1
MQTEPIGSGLYYGWNSASSQNIVTLRPPDTLATQLPLGQVTIGSSTIQNYSIKSLKKQNYNVLVDTGGAVQWHHPLLQLHRHGERPQHNARNAHVFAQVRNKMWCQESTTTWQQTHGDHNLHLLNRFIYYV